jgi:Xaa-Pro aminopeptidase
MYLSLQSYCTNMARTLFIDPTERHKEAYKLLLKVYLACTQVYSLRSPREMQSISRVI